MRGITSGLQPRRYADGDLVEEDKGFFGGVMDFFKEYGPMASLPMAAYEYATDPEKAKERYTKEGLSKRNEQFKDYIFDYTDPIEYATLPLYLAGPAGAAANKGIKAARVANKIKKAGPAEKILDNKATKGILNIGGPVAGISADIAIDPEIDFGDVVDAGKYYGTQAVDSVKNIFTNDAVDDAQEDVDKANKKETEKQDEKDENLTEEEKEKKSFLEKMGQVFEAYGASQGVGGAPKGIAGQMIRGPSINTPEITRYQGGGIADMMPQEPMMMAGGGMVPGVNGGMVPGYGLGSFIKKKVKDTVKKRAKKKTDKAKAKADSQKPSTSTDLVPYEGRNVSRDSFIPTYLQPIASGAAAIRNKIVSPSQYSPTAKQVVGNLGFIGGIGAIGAGLNAAFSGEPESTAEEKAKAQALLDKAAADKALKERQEAREGLTALPEIRAARALERAQEAGRTEPTFIDYVATFPASYTEKIGKDPEFAQQMMAGFIAMAKPTEGFVPRNAFVDFGEAAMKEKERQEGEVPEALQTLIQLEKNPELKKVYLDSKKTQISPDKLQEGGNQLLNSARQIVGFKLNVKLDGKDNLVDPTTQPPTIVTALRLANLYNNGVDIEAYASTLIPEKK